MLSWSLVALGRYADAENYALKGYAIRRDPRLTETLGETAYFLGRNDAALRNFQNYVGAVSEGGRVGTRLLLHGRDIPAPRALQPRRHRLFHGPPVYAR